MSKYTIEIIVFVCGAIVMILEIIGSRVLAPFLGTSIITWTSLIGVILGSLSLGYFLGGHLADRNPTPQRLTWILFLAGFSIGVIVILDMIVLNIISSYPLGLMVQTILATIILFAPASILLGMVSPYAAKLKIVTLKKSATTIGNLYALSTLGSIIGTFLAGFFLLSIFGHTKILIGLSITLFCLSFLSTVKNKKPPSFKVILLLIIFISIIISLSQTDDKLIDIDTAYSRVWIYKTKDYKVGTLVQMMQIDNGNSSAMFLNNDDLVFQYTKFYRLIGHFNPNIKRALLIGGAGYSYPKDFLKNFKKAKLDVVEIDPQVTALARKYFKLENHPGLTIYHEDGRMFINNTKNKYDAVLIDAFKDTTIAYQLTTQEAISEIYNMLNDDGVVIINLISSIDGVKGKLLRAELLTYQSIFPNVYIFTVGKKPSDRLQNLILIALKNSQTPTLKSSNLELNEYLSNLWEKNIEKDVPILTDEYAPIDQYIIESL